MGRASISPMADHSRGVAAVLLALAVACLGQPEVHMLSEQDYQTSLKRAQLAVGEASKALELEEANPLGKVDFGPALEAKEDAQRVLQRIKSIKGAKSQLMAPPRTPAQEQQLAAFEHKVAKDVANEIEGRVEANVEQKLQAELQAKEAVPKPAPKKVQPAALPKPAPKKVQPAAVPKPAPKKVQPAAVPKP